MNEWIKNNAIWLDAKEKEVENCEHNVQQIYPPTPFVHTPRKLGQSEVDKIKEMLRPQRKFGYYFLSRAAYEALKRDREQDCQRQLVNPAFDSSFGFPTFVKEEQKTDCILIGLKEAALAYKNGIMTEQELLDACKYPIEPETTDNQSE
jgi:hypothetical protein